MHAVIAPPSPAAPDHAAIAADCVVRRRIAEYLGGNEDADPTCLFIGRFDPVNPSRFERRPITELQDLIRQGCEVARSLGDRTSVIVHLDVEYVNFDDPSAAYTDPNRAFSLQEPVVAAIENRLLDLGIRYLHLVTGQGHHFAWRVLKGSPTARALARMGICTTPDLDTPPDPVFAHLSLLMEFLAHRIKADAAHSAKVPVEITARHVGKGTSGRREMVSVDISEYGDPLRSRMIRIPYTLYRKPWISGMMRREGLEASIPEFYTLPQHEMGIRELISLRHHTPTVLRMARRAGTAIPVSEQGTARLLEQYRRSGLCKFHRRFYARGHGRESPRTLALRAECLRRLPPCARHGIDHPNDILLKPSGMQLLTRCLLAMEMHPRHIAGWITDRFRDPSQNWGVQWENYDQAARADFYVRLFAGEIDQGLESGIDFNCVSEQEKGFCHNPRQCSLTPFHAVLYPSPSPQPAPAP